MKDKLTNLFKKTMLLLVFALVGATQVKAQESYGLMIAGRTVTSENCNDLSVIPGVSGTVNYNPETKTLTLDNSEIIYSENYSIENVSIDSLIVNVIGENNIKNNSNGTIFWISCSSTITGGGTLTIDANSGTCITIEDTVVIENCTLNAKGRRGIRGICGEEALIIRNANVTADGRDGAVVDLNSLILDGCEITTPEGAAFNETKHYVALNGFLVTGKVIFTPNVVGYGLKIAGTIVTTENCNDLSVIPGVSGTVNYNPETNTLTLDNATITYSGDEENCIENFSLDSLAIKVLGENNLKSGAATIYANSRPITITGGGTLYLESNNCGIYFKNSLEIDSCTVNAKGYWGIAGDVRDENLTIRNATVTATGNAGSICDIATLTLDGCKIITPAGATFDESQHAIVLDGETVTDKVVITNDPTVGIKGVKATQPAHKQGIYSLDGVYLGNDFNALPKGIYIKDGKKVKK